MGEFQWRSEVKSKVEDRIKQWSANRNVSVIVGIHNRMKDYYNHLNYMYGNGTKPAGENYFRKAMNYYR